MSEQILTGDPGLPEPTHAHHDDAAVDAATADGNIQDDDAASLSDTAVVSDEAQDLEDRAPSAFDIPPFGDDADLPPRRA